MRIHQILHHRRNFRRQRAASLLDKLRKPGWRGVVIYEEAFHGDSKGIVVHGSGEAAAPNQIRRTLPDFRGCISFRIEPPHVRVPITPELRWPLERHIKSPTINSSGNVAVRFHPALRRVEDVALWPGVHIFAIHRGGEDREGLHSPPSLVGKLVPLRSGIVKTLDHVPVFIARALLVLSNIFEGEEIATGMVKYSVQNDAHTSRVALLDQLQKKLVRGRPFPRGRIGCL